ncbi:MAG: hypothetical protein ABW122_03605, partial [Ilumatobacteraceae bacterium]
PATSPGTGVPSSSAVPTTTLAVGPTIADLVPSVAAFAEPLSTPEEVSAEIDQLLVSPHHDVASDKSVSALCAVVVLTVPLDAKGRWERDGRRVNESALELRNPPGYGECVGNGDAALEDGSYQYIATDADGAESAAAGFVVGATPVDQVFTNGGPTPICSVRIAPTPSRYFEVYVLATPMGSGELTVVRVADVRQDVEAVSCDDGDVVASFDFDPAPGSPQVIGG